jgi:hypothetical protein
MSYYKTDTVKGNSSDRNNTGLGSSNYSKNNSSEFYELEPAIVLDIILDENHPLLKTKNVDITSFPDNYKDTTPNIKDIDCTWIGRILVRPCFSQQAMLQEKLNWAIPLDVTGIVEYPLINEVVVVVNYFGTLYYTKRLNFQGFINNGANYKMEKVYGINNGITGSSNMPISLLTNKANETTDYLGTLGNYFLTNNKIRRLKKFEGDTSIESRFGQSIRFSTYNNDRSIDGGKYVDYKGNHFAKGSFGGGGNPMMLIRNRQRKLAIDSPIVTHPLLPAIPPIVEQEKNTGGIIEEDINHDGTSVHVTSGLTETKWRTTVYKSMFGHKSEEQPLFNGVTKFKYPKLDGDQLILNTDRIIFSSRFGETFHYSKKRYGIVTDSEYTVDAQDQVVISTNTKTVFNSPAIYLGQGDETNEPALLGQTSVNWLYDLCNWLKMHVHIERRENPTGVPKQQDSLTALQSKLDQLLSKRVFLTGGGFAPGANGIIPANYDGDAIATVINVTTGRGVPGGFRGVKKRT